MGDSSSKLMLSQAGYTKLFCAIARPKHGSVALGIRENERQAGCSLPPFSFSIDLCFEVGCRGMFPIIELAAVGSDIESRNLITTISFSCEGRTVWSQSTVGALCIKSMRNPWGDLICRTNVVQSRFQCEVQYSSSLPAFQSQRKYQ